MSIRKKTKKFIEWYLKHNDKEIYNRFMLAHTKFEPPTLKEIDDEFTQTAALINHPSQNHLYKQHTAFVHSGNSGDVIYALPSVFELSKNGNATIFLRLNKEVVYGNFHPLGNVMLSERMATMLVPLLMYQPQIEACKIYEDEEIDYDLDSFRSYNILLERGNIARWYFYVYGISAPLHEAWLIAPRDPVYEDYIIIARSHRYREPLIDYSFLKKYPKIIFLGVQEEYEDMLLQIPHLEWKEVNDFLEMATIINSGRLFIGNQSFPFAIAEALKVNRLLEVFYRSPNVIVEGKGANDFMYQPQFENTAAKLYEQSF